MEGRTGEYFSFLIADRLTGERIDENGEHMFLDKRGNLMAGAKFLIRRLYEFRAFDRDSSLSPITILLNPTYSYPGPGDPYYLLNWSDMFSGTFGDSRLKIFPYGYWLNMEHPIVSNEIAKLENAVRRKADRRYARRKAALDRSARL